MKNREIMKKLKLDYIESIKSLDLPPVEEGEETVTLYHGTSSIYLPNILKEGLKPRSATGIDNWSHLTPSIPNVVYLTNKWHYFYAVNAATDTYYQVYGDNWSSIDGFDDIVEYYPCYIKLEVPRSRLILDEDIFLSNYFEGVVDDCKQRNKEIILDPIDAIANYGTVGYLGAIPPEYIKGFGIIANKKIMAMCVFQGEQYAKDYEIWQTGKGLGVLSLKDLEKLEFSLPLNKYYDVSLLPKNKEVTGVKVNFKSNQVKLKFQKK